MIFFLDSVFSITVGFVGLLVTYIIIFSQKSNRYVNTYLALILFIVSMKSIHGGIFQNDKLVVLGVDFNWLKILPIITLPFSYLYFESLFKDRNQIKKKVYLHFKFFRSTRSNNALLSNCLRNIMATFKIRGLSLSTHHLMVQFLG
jgi:hypothetical protein